MRNAKRLVVAVIIAAISALLVIAIGTILGFSVGAPTERLLVNAAANDDLVRFKKIAAKGVSLDVQEQGMLGHTPLIATTFSKGTNVFFYLLSAGAKVDARARDGKTALMAAVMLGDENLIKTKALIEAGADVNVRGDHGATPLAYARWASIGGHVATNTITLLEQHGAKID